MVVNHRKFRACLHGGGGPQVGGPQLWSKNKTRLHAILQPRVLGWDFLRLLLRLQLRILSWDVPSSHLEKNKILIYRHICIYSWKRHALCYAVFGFARNRWLNTLYGIVWETKYGRFTTLNIPKCEHFTLLVCPLRVTPPRRVTSPTLGPPPPCKLALVLSLRSVTQTWRCPSQNIRPRVIFYDEPVFLWT